jgi:dTDP-4-dehydrorhamnose 3,5-epimerase-like enzyme
MNRGVVMEKFMFIETEIEDLYVIETKIFGDNRGYFMETYNEKDFKKAGLNQSTTSITLTSNLFLLAINND